MVAANLTEPSGYGVPALRREERKLFIERCEGLLGQKAVDVSFPGGKSRDSIRLRLADGTTVIGTRRSSGNRGLLERRVLSELSVLGAPVPAILARDRDIIIQQDVGTRRLTEVLDGLSPIQTLAWLDRGLESLRAIYQAADQCRWTADVATIGLDRPWRQEFAETPLRLARHFGLPEPQINIESIAKRLRPKRHGLVKWDARPGNAIVADDDTVYWIDWEHCGRRSRIDDAAWLIADEYVTDLGDFENAALNTWVEQLVGANKASESLEYLAIFGTMHMGIRLGLILSHKGDGPWWSHEHCLAGDKIGITREAAVRTCRRASRWASRSDLLRDVVQMYDSAADIVEQL